jgi:hypothetical protein
MAVHPAVAIALRFLPNASELSPSRWDSEHAPHVALILNLDDAADDSSASTSATFDVTQQAWAG